jgi:Bacterial regulatory proteins, tetR family
MGSRAYRLGRRQPAVDRTQEAILAAARHLASEAPVGELSVGAVARAAGVSRITVYNRFGSRAGLLATLQPPSPGLSQASHGDARTQLRSRLVSACTSWSSDPALFRNLNRPSSPAAADFDRALAERLAAADMLRPGCSIKEAEDVIGALTSFAVFDRLHKDGRRPPLAVAEILGRLASAILGQPLA